MLILCCRWIISFTHTLGATSNTKTLLFNIERSQSEGGGGPVLSIKCLFCAWYRASLLGNELFIFLMRKICFHRRQAHIKHNTLMYSRYWVALFLVVRKQASTINSLCIYDHLYRHSNYLLYYVSLLKIIRHCLVDLGQHICIYLLTRASTSQWLVFHNYQWYVNYIHQHFGGFSKQCSNCYYWHLFNTV